MKQTILRFWLTALVALVSAASYAYDACIDGIYYNFSESEATVTYKFYDGYNQNGYSGNVTIPSTVEYNKKKNSVTTIGNGAFKYCTSLTSVTISKSVTSIGANAFYECINLTSIDIPESVTTIKHEAFVRCM